MESYTLSDSWYEEWLNRALQIIDVLQSQSSAEFHDKVRLLPVTIVARRGQNSLGQEGIWRVYTHRTGHSLKLFTPYGAESDDPPAPTPPGLGESGLPEDAPSLSAGGPHIAAQRASLDCEYTDDDNNYWSGPCATQQEIDDGAILQVSYEADLESMEYDMQEAVTTYCELLTPAEREEPENAEMCGMLQSEAQDASHHDGAIDLVLGGPHVEPDDASHGAVFDPRESIKEFTWGEVAPATCLAQALAWAGSWVHASTKVYRLFQVITAVNPPAGAIASAVIAGGSAVAIAAGATYLWADCLTQS